MASPPPKLESAVRDARAFIKMGKSVDEARYLLERDFGTALAAQALRITASERRTSAILEGALGLVIGGGMVVAGAALLFAHDRYYSGAIRGSAGGKMLGLSGFLIAGGLAVLARIFLKRD